MSKHRDRPIPALLSQALHRAAAERAALRGEPYEAPPPDATPPAPARGFNFRMRFGVALGALALVIAALAAWNFAKPKSAPVLKLDYGLDVTRMDASRQSSLPGPGPSK